MYVQKLLGVIYTNENQLNERECPFMTSKYKIKYLDTNLIRTVQNLHEKTWKAFLYIPNVDFKK